MFDSIGKSNFGVSFDSRSHFLIKSRIWMCEAVILGNFKQLFTSVKRTSFVGLYVVV